MTQEQRDQETARKAVNVLMRNLDLPEDAAISEDVLEQFKEDFINKLIERKPFVLFCDHAPDAFFQGMRGLDELTPYFSFKLSMIFFWMRGIIRDTRFEKPISKR